MPIRKKYDVRTSVSDVLDHQVNAKVSVRLIPGGSELLLAIQQGRHPLKVCWVSSRIPNPGMRHLGMPLGTKETYPEEME